MLYLNGMKFEAIAKWIGHAHPSITSNVYGRLSQEDVHLTGVPFADEGAAEQSKAEWERVARFLREPYAFPEDEWVGLKRRHGGSSGGSSKRQALEYARRMMPDDGGVPLNDIIRSVVQEVLRDRQG